jgi:tripartite-type tricarboxylate transporter receptor subunit TctC
LSEEFLDEDRKDTMTSVTEFLVDDTDPCNASNQRNVAERVLFQVLRALFFSSVFSCIVVAHAQGFPGKTVRVIVPFPAGGPNDVITRVVADGMRESLGQSVIVENRAGAAGTIGSEAGARATPDGYTLTLGSTSTHSLPTLLGQKISYDPKRSFVPVGLIGLSPTVLAVSNKVPAKDINEFIEYARQNPGRLSYASSGVGSLAHLAGESFKLDTKTFIVHIPYRGTGQAMVDLAGGQIDMMFDAIVTARTQADAGKIKILATGGLMRVSGLNVPTLDEVGLKKFDASLWIGLFAPSGTPAEVVEKLNAALVKALRMPATQERLAKLGVTPAPGPSSELARYMQDVESYWRKIVVSKEIKSE